MPPKTNEELKNQTQLNAVAYSPEIIAVRAVLAKHLNEWNGELIRDLATLLSAKDKQREEEKEALTNAIMSSVHEQEISDGTQYPKITTHALAKILKTLVPSFSYHGYRRKLVEEAVAEARREVYKEARKFANNLGTIEMCEEYEDFLMSLTTPTN